MIDQRFHFLLRRFKDDRLSEAEAVEFEQMILSGRYDEWLEADIAASLEKRGRHSVWTPEKQAALLEATLQRLPGEAIGGHTGRLVALRRSLRYGWVAAVLLFAIVMIWRLLPPGRPQVADRPIIRPGASKAILRLDKGQEVLLDSSSRLQVGNAQVSNGQVSYTTTKAIAYNTLETPKGGRYRLILPDGSKVWLNSASSVRYPTVFTTARREVELTGEAYFEVNEDKARPFVVRTGSVHVQVLGTSFDVMAYDDEGAVRTTLVTGAVRLEAGAEQKLLAPGQQSYLEDRHFVVKRPDLEQVLAWKNGLFDFNGADIKAMMRQIMRWYDVDVVYSPNLSNIQFSGVISQREDIRPLLEILEETGKVRFRLEGRKLTVLPGDSK